MYNSEAFCDQIHLQREGTHSGITSIVSSVVLCASPQSPCCVAVRLGAQCCLMHHLELECRGNGCRLIFKIKVMMRVQILKNNNKPISSALALLKLLQANLLLWCIRMRRGFAQNIGISFFGVKVAVSILILGENSSNLYLLEQLHAVLRLSGRVPSSSSKGRGFDPRQERRENLFLQGQFLC